MPSPLANRRLLALLLAVAAALRPRRARANGGAVQLADQPIGPYRLTVTTSPNPLRVGTADVSVLVLEGVDTLVPDATVTVTAQGPAAGAPAVAYAATHAQATNQQYYAANVRLGAAGRWRMRVAVAGPKGGGEASFGVDVSAAVLGMTPVEAGCTALPALGILAILVAELRRFLRRRARLRGVASRD